MNFIKIGHKLTTFLPALGSLANMAGFPTAGKVLSFAKRFKTLFTLISLKKHYDEWIQPKSSQIDAGVYYGDLADKALSLFKKGVKFAALYDLTLPISPLFTPLSIATHAGKAWQAKNTIARISHALAVSAKLAKYGKSPPIRVFGKLSTLIGSGIEIWLALGKSSSE